MKHTSAEWQELVKDHIIVMDPDGWDRSPEGWSKNWNDDLISFDEFMQKVMVSTCQFIWGDCQSIMEIFELLERRFGQEIKP
jgi:hypothetical protein